MSLFDQSGTARSHQVLGHHFRFVFVLANQDMNVVLHATDLDGFHAVSFLKQCEAETGGGLGSVTRARC